MSRSDGRSPGRSEADEAGALRAERALGVVYRVVLPRLRRADSGRLGVSRPSYDRLFVRGQEFALQIAAETGQWMERVVRELEDDALASGGTGEWRRIERRHLEEAALELRDFVSGMLPPVRLVVELRARGAKWSRVAELLPERALFSVRDDWDRAVARVWAERDDLVVRLT